jgi:hypothetical protein
VVHVPLTLLLKQAVDKPAGQNLSSRGEGESSPLSLVVAKTQVQSNRFQTEMDKKKEHPFKIFERVVT